MHASRQMPGGEGSSPPAPPPTPAMVGHLIRRSRSACSADGAPETARHRRHYTETSGFHAANDSAAMGKVRWWATIRAASFSTVSSQLCCRLTVENKKLNISWKDSEVFVVLLLPGILWLMGCNCMLVFHRQA